MTKTLYKKQKLFIFSNLFGLSESSKITFTKVFILEKNEKILIDRIGYVHINGLHVINSVRVINIIIFEIFDVKFVDVIYTRDQIFQIHFGRSYFIFCTKSYRSQNSTFLIQILG